MARDLRTERWRATHRRLLLKHRTGTDRLMGRQLRTPVSAGGQGRDVEVAIGKRYVPMEWDGDDPRVKALHAYTPKIHHKEWCSHKELIYDLVLRTDHFDQLRDRHLAGTMHRLLVFAHRRHYSLDPIVLLTGDRIDEFIKATYSEGSRTTHRWRLRHLAATVFPPPPESAYTRRAPLPPHTASERTRFLAACESLVTGHKRASQKRQELYREVRVLLALTFGAGCNGKSVHQVREGWLRDEPDGMWLHHPDRLLPTPIGKRWADTLRSCLTGDPDRWLLRADTPNSRGEQAGKVLFRARKAAPGMTGFDTDRAARTWHVAVLDEAGFGVVAAMVGYQPGSQTPVDLAQYITIVDDTANRELLRGLTS